MQQTPETTLIVIPERDEQINRITFRCMCFECERVCIRVFGVFGFGLAIQPYAMGSETELEREMEIFLYVCLSFFSWLNSILSLWFEECDIRL